MTLAVKNFSSMYGPGRNNMAAGLKSKFAVWVHPVIGAVSVLLWMMSVPERSEKFLYLYTNRALFIKASALPTGALTAIPR